MNNKKKKPIFKVIKNLQKGICDPEGCMNSDELYSYMADDSDFFNGFTDEEIEVVKQRILSGILKDEPKEDQIKKTMKVIYNKMYDPPRPH